MKCEQQSIFSMTFRVNTVYPIFFFTFVNLILGKETLLIKKKQQHL